MHANRLLKGENHYDDDSTWNTEKVFLAPHTSEWSPPQGWLQMPIWYLALNPPVSPQKHKSSDLPG